MNNEQKFETINSNDDKSKRLIHTEPNLLFYSLKILISVLDGLKEVASSDDKIQVDRN